MFLTNVLRTSRTTYRGSKGSGSGASSKTTSRSSPASRNTLGASVLSGQNFKRAQTGLYEAALPQSGNSIPKSVQKTARTWRPNVSNKFLYSPILQDYIKFKVSAKALKTIEKYGGIEQYLAHRDEKYLGEAGIAMRNKLGEAVRQKAVSGQISKIAAGAAHRKVSASSSSSPTSASTA